MAKEMRAEAGSRKGEGQGEVGAEAFCRRGQSVAESAQDKLVKKRSNDYTRKQPKAKRPRDKDTQRHWSFWGTPPKRKRTGGRRSNKRKSRKEAVITPEGKKPEDPRTNGPVTEAWEKSDRRAEIKKGPSSAMRGKEGKGPQARC